MSSNIRTQQHSAAAAAAAAVAAVAVAAAAASIGMYRLGVAPGCEGPVQSDEVSTAAQGPGATRYSRPRHRSRRLAAPPRPTHTAGCSTGGHCQRYHSITCSSGAQASITMRGWGIGADKQLQPFGMLAEASTALDFHTWLSSEHPTLLCVLCYAMLCCAVLCFAGVGQGAGHSTDVQHASPPAAPGQLLSSPQAVLQPE
jgi:hypothetical protein